jgi:hypothetical protein
MKTIIGILITIVLFYNNFLQNIDEGLNILRKSDGFRNSENSSAEVLITIKTYNKQNEISEIKYDVWYKGHDKSLVKQSYPLTSKGNLILMNGPNMWYYKPGSANPLRITPQQKLLGSASTADIANMGFSFDYDAKLIGTDTSAGRSCYKLDLSAKDQSKSYQKITYYVDKSNFLPIKAEFLTISGRILKTALYSDYKTFIENFQTPSRMTIFENIFNKNIYTSIEYNTIKRKEFPDKYFNYNYLMSIK